jgi:hypothetical protein
MNDKNAKRLREARLMQFTGYLVMFMTALFVLPLVGIFMQIDMLGMVQDGQVVAYKLLTVMPAEDRLIRVYLLAAIMGGMLFSRVGHLLVVAGDSRAFSARFMEEAGDQLVEKLMEELVRSGRIRIEDAKNN